MGKKYIDEKLAKARRTYIEDMINQKEDKGVWKGMVYSLVPYTVGRLGFRVKVPDFLLQALQESREDADVPDSPFACMVSVKDMISITFYVTAETKRYEPSEIHLLFGRLFPGNHLSSVECAGERGGVHYFDYIKDESGTPFLHTIFLYETGNRQIMGQLNGEAQEWENLVQMRDKILAGIERRCFFEGNESKGGSIWICQSGRNGDGSESK